MKANKRIRYYENEATDDFQTTKTFYNVTVDGKFNYLPKSVFFRAWSFFFYHFIAFPILWLINFFVFSVRVKGRKNLKELRGKGYFIYANHSHAKDSYLAPISIVPFRKVYIIANKDAFAIPIVASMVKWLGALPVPDNVSGLKNLNSSLKKIMQKNRKIMIYPEAHIWPYYTGVRPFPVTSFKFPAHFNAPAVPVAVCYKKRWLFGSIRKPRTVVYIGKPVYPLADLSERDNATYLRDHVFDFVKFTVERESTYAYFEYKKAEPKTTLDETIQTEKTA